MGKVNPKVLIIGLTWPEPMATAAGVRINQLIGCLRLNGYEITFCSAAAPSAYPELPDFADVAMVPVRLNHDSFDKFLTELDPGIVIFDRFLTEEYFGWRVARYAPRAMRILDTQDLHSLRKSREIALNGDLSFQPSFWKAQDITKRELASIYRCDLSLVISEFEMEWLLTHSPLDPFLLCYMPFFFDNADRVPPDERPVFEERRDFVFIGNGRHNPNTDAILFLKNSVWPEIRKQIPEANLYVYGAHLPKQITGLTDQARGFHVKGWVKDSTDVVKKARLNLIPLRFGAGLKGKLFEATLCGTPSLMTPVAAEGTAFGKHLELIGDTAESLASKATLLYRNKTLWEEMQREGDAILTAEFNREVFCQQLSSTLAQIRENLREHREKNLIGGMLMHHTMAGSEYLSRWISLKEERAGEAK